MDYSNLFVCLLGMGIVFLGLIMLIALVSVMSRVVMATDKKPAAASAAPAAPVAATPAAAPAAAVTPAMVAAISAAIAEASGTDAAALRIVSIKQI